MADVKKILNNMTIEEKIGQLMQQNANVFIKTDAQITGKQFDNGYTQDELSSDTLNSNGEIEAVVTVRNDSNIDGKETVMLYMRDLVASTSRPVQQLVSFEKVDIKAGETKQIKFKVTEPMLRFWNDNDEFVSEKGKFQLSTGYADHLIFTKEFELI